LLERMEDGVDGLIYEVRFVEQNLRELRNESDDVFVERMEELRDYATMQSWGDSLGGPPRRVEIISLEDEGEDEYVAETAGRVLCLTEVFKDFDVEESGAVAPTDMLVVAELDHWMNMRVSITKINVELLASIPLNAKGNVEESQFVQHCVDLLDLESDQDFMQRIKAFRKCAKKAASSPVGGGASLSLTVRKEALLEVFKEFDLDRDGQLGLTELVNLRRDVHLQKGSWVFGRNAELRSKVDNDADGALDAAEFVSYFAKAMPPTKGLFEQELISFMKAAASSQMDGPMSFDAILRLKREQPLGSPAGHTLAAQSTYKKYRLESNEELDARRLYSPREKPSRNRVDGKDGPGGAPGGARHAASIQRAMRTGPSQVQLPPRKLPSVKDSPVGEDNADTGLTMRQKADALAGAEARYKERHAFRSPPSTPSEFSLTPVQQEAAALAQAHAKYKKREVTRVSPMLEPVEHKEQPQSPAHSEAKRLEMREKELAAAHAIKAATKQSHK